MLFWSTCRVAETIADTGKPKLDVAIDLLVSAVNPMIKRDEALRVITDAFRHVGLDGSPTVVVLKRMEA
jgi:hypothetical protein